MGDAPSATTGLAEKKPLVKVSVKVIDWLDSSVAAAGPLVIEVAQPLTVWAPASSRIVRLAPLTKPGSSFTAVTVTVTVSLSAVSRPPSSALAVTTTEPFWWAARPNVRLRAALNRGVDSVPS